MIVKPKEFIIDFFGHMDDIDIKAGAHPDLIQCVEHIIGFADCRRRNNSYIVDIIIAQQLFEPIEDTADFIQRPETDVMGLEYFLPIHNLLGYIFNDFHIRH